MPVITDRRRDAPSTGPSGRRRVVTRRVTTIRRVRVVVPPKPWWRQVLDAPPAILSGLRWYQRVPARLRRPEPAARLAVTGLTLWFAALFVMLGVLAGRTGALDHPGSPAGAGGFYLAAILGVAGLALFLTRRLRVGLGLIGAMLVLAQGTVLAALI